MKNSMFEQAKKISDYFGMVTRIALGFGVAYILWIDDTIAGKFYITNRAISIVIGIVTCYLCFCFTVSVFEDVSKIFDRKNVKDKPGLISTVAFLAVTFSMMYGSIVLVNAFLK